MPTAPSSLPLTNYYALLAQFLSPQINEKNITLIRNAIDGKQIIWVSLLKEAGSQRCVPLLYVRLNQHNLFHKLPKAIQNIITGAYQNNRQRNKILKEKLIQLLQKFEENQIESLLLKGAATFCDDPYGDPGARVMGDLDILVHPKDVKTCQHILEKQGYIEIPDPGMTLEGVATDSRHHQIPAYQHPDTRVIVEIHFNVSYGQAGRIVPTEQAWANKIETTLSHYKTATLSIQDKVLLNTAHALLPKREFIRGEISLLQLADFATLISQKENKINWDNWGKTAQQHYLTTAFMTYLFMSHQLMNIPWPFTSTAPKTVKNNAEKIQGKSNNPSQLTKLKQDLSYYLKLPRWVWNNVCYAPGIKNFPPRLMLLIKVIFRARSWSKI